MDERKDAGLELFFYECEDCRAVFPHTEEASNRCSKCGKLLKKMSNQDPN